MSKQVSVMVFKFDELSPKVQERVISAKLVEMHEDVNEFLVEQFRDKLEELNYPLKDVRFSLNSCQGDGVAFYGKIKDSAEITALFKRILGNEFSSYDKNIWENIEAWIEKSQSFSRYDHWNTMNVSFSIDNSPNPNFELDPAVEDKLLSALKNDVVKTSKLLESLGYESLPSEQDAIEQLREDNLHYFATGVIYTD